MIIPYKNREIKTDRPVQVYRNLHDKDGTRKWALRQRGKVVAHGKDFFLEFARFVVNPAGQRRVRKEKQKNVHAYATGIIKTTPPQKFEGYGIISYNPYTDDRFQITVAAVNRQLFVEPVEYEPMVRFDEHVECVVVLL